MNPAIIGQYLELLDKFIKMCSAAVPIFTLILRKWGWVGRDKKPEPNDLSVVGGVVGFGCLGSVMGLALTIICGILGIIFLGIKWMNIQTNGSFGLAPMDWGILGELFSRTNLIVVASSIISTLLAFGGKDQPKGLAFIAGLSFGTAIALMFLLSAFIH